MARSHPVKLSDIEETYGSLSDKKIAALERGEALTFLEIFTFRYILDYQQSIHRLGFF